MGLGQDSTTILLKLINDKDFRKKYAPNDLLVLFAAGNFLLALLTFVILLINNIKK